MHRVAYGFSHGSMGVHVSRGAFEGAGTRTVLFRHRKFEDAAEKEFQNALKKIRGNPAGAARKMVVKRKSVVDKTVRFLVSLDLGAGVFGSSLLQEGPHKV